MTDRYHVCADRYYVCGECSHVHMAPQLPGGAIGTCVYCGRVGSLRVFATFAEAEEYSRQRLAYVRMWGVMPLESE